MKHINLRNPVDGSTQEVDPADTGRLKRLAAMGYLVVKVSGNLFDGNSGPETVTLPAGSRVVRAPKAPAKKRTTKK